MLVKGPKCRYRRVWLLIHKCNLYFNSINLNIHKDFSEYLENHDKDGKTNKDNHTNQKGYVILTNEFCHKVPTSFTSFLDKV